VKKNKSQVSYFFNYGISILAWLCFFLMLLVLIMGEDILQKMGHIYPHWSFAVFFIPWFLVLISSVQKLRDHHSNIRLRIWILKTTLPIFVFIAPFFSQFLNISTLCIDDCILSNTSLSEGGPYTFYLAVIVLFLLHFLPCFNAKQKSVREDSPHTNDTK